MLNNRSASFNARELLLAFYSGYKVSSAWESRAHIQYNSAVYNFTYSELLTTVIIWLEAKL